MLFSDRIHYLANIFGIDRLAELIYGADAINVGEWSNKLTIENVPYGVSFAPLLHYYPEFNKQWLEDGFGQIFVNGTEEDNIKSIQNKEGKL